MLVNSTASRGPRPKLVARGVRAAGGAPQRRQVHKGCASCARWGGPGATRAPKASIPVSGATRATSIRICRDNQVVNPRHARPVSGGRGQPTRDARTALRVNTAAGLSSKSPGAFRASLGRGATLKVYPEILIVIAAPSESMATRRVPHAKKHAQIALPVGTIQLMASEEMPQIASSVLRDAMERNKAQRPSTSVSCAPRVLLAWTKAWLIPTVQASVLPAHTA